MDAFVKLVTAGPLFFLSAWLLMISPASPELMSASSRSGM